MGAVRLGKIHLRWCGQCDVPVLEEKTCGACGGATRGVNITPPGDARPAFSKDIERTKGIIDSQFGEGAGRAVIPDGRIVLLNKAPDIDRMDEVIVGGHVVGAVRYDLATGERFLLRPASAVALAAVAVRNWVEADDGAAEAVRSRNASTLAVGVLDCDPSIERGSEVLVLDRRGNPVSVGLAKMSAEEMLGHKRGTAVKTRWIVEDAVPPEKARMATWEDAVRANAKVLDRRVQEAQSFIRKTVRGNDLPVAVSYSGGKDSLATLLLVLEAGLRPKLLFIDTGLEFDETVRNVHEISERYSLELLVESAGDSFWKNVGFFGPPGRDFRWCCKTCKLGPATRIIHKNFPDGVLSFIGQRAYESEQRASKGSLWRNPWTPGQLSASPIQKWSAMHVWLYLMSRDAQVNPLYEQGLERIGCFMCPATDLAELRRAKAFSPQYARWQEFLEAHAASTGRTDKWLRYDLWRWRRIPKSVRDELGGDVIATEQRTADNADSRPLGFKTTSGYSPCVEGLSMEGVFTKPLHMDRVANMLNALGEVTTAPDLNIAEVDKMTIFREGPVMIRGKTDAELQTKAARLREIVLRAMNCAGCGICTGRCPTGALVLDGRIAIDLEKCNHCGSCLGKCPVVSFREAELDI